jgi:hypothetical protein
LYILNFIIFGTKLKINDNTQGFSYKGRSCRCRNNYNAIGSGSGQFFIQGIAAGRKEGALCMGWLDGPRTGQMP